MVHIKSPLQTSTGRKRTPGFDGIPDCIVGGIPIPYHARPSQAHVRTRITGVPESPTTRGELPRKAAFECPEIYAELAGLREPVRFQQPLRKWRTARRSIDGQIRVLA
jgi:hypothetical protein